MRLDFHFHFYSRVGIIATLLFALFFIHQSIKTPVSTYADDTREINIIGWAWSETAGWVSLNCLNDFDGDGDLDNTCSSVNYGLNVVNSGNVYVRGCIWSGTPLNSGGLCSDSGNSCMDDLDCLPSGTCEPVTLGWICFSDPSGTGASNAPISGIVTSSLYINALDPSAYASILSLESMPGEAWKLGFPIQDQINPYSNYPINGCFNCYEEYSYECNLSGAVCDPSGAPCPNYGSPPQAQSCVVSDIDYNCDNCLEYFYYDEPAAFCSQTGTSCLVGGQATCDSEGVLNNNCINYQAGDLEGVIGAYQCTDCIIEDYDNVCGFSAYQANINRCNSCDSVWQTPGLMIDNRHNQVEVGGNGYLCGWAWNSWLDPLSGTDYGLGWLQFGPRISTSTRPYVATEGGNIYSKGDIFGRYYPPFGQTNASFLIESNGSITNFISSSTLSGLYQGELPHRPSIDFLSLVGGKYKNALGTIDYTGLISTAYSVGLNSYNKYGSLIVEDPLNFVNEFSIAGNGRVIRINGDLSVDNGFSVKMGAVGPIEPERGSITVVVEGNLTINANISYETGVSVRNLKQIPSIVWLVKGDVYIDPAVTNIVGTFVVLGNGNSCGPISTCGDPYSGLDTGCGQFVSCVGDASDCGVSPLQLSGNVLARQFELCRSYYDHNNPVPAEYFVSDGRLQANPPAGFLDFSKVVPRFSETPN